LAAAGWHRQERTSAIKTAEKYMVNRTDFVGHTSFKAAAEDLCGWQQRVGTTWRVRLQSNSKSTTER
jgi:hypothetical protein